MIAGNEGTNCAGAGFASEGTNLDDDGTCPGSTPIEPGVDFDTELADNGGPTATHALLEGSVAVDAAGDCLLPTDQRGFPRDADCDAGAYELGARPSGEPEVVASRPASPADRSRPRDRELPR